MEARAADGWLCHPQEATLHTLRKATADPLPVVQPVSSRQPSVTAQAAPGWSHRTIMRACSERKDKGPGQDGSAKGPGPATRSTRTPSPAPVVLADGSRSTCLAHLCGISHLQSSLHRQAGVAAFIWDGVQPGGHLRGCVPEAGAFAQSQYSKRWGIQGGRGRQADELTVMQTTLKTQGPANG